MKVKELKQRLDGIPDDYDVHVLPDKPIPIKGQLKHAKKYSTTQLKINVYDYNKTVYIV